MHAKWSPGGTASPSTEDWEGCGLRAITVLRCSWLRCSCGLGDGRLCVRVELRRSPERVRHSVQSVRAGCDCSGKLGCAPGEPLGEQGVSCPLRRELQGHVCLVGRQGYGLSDGEQRRASRLASRSDGPRSLPLWSSLSRRFDLYGRSICKGRPLLVGVHRCSTWHRGVERNRRWDGDDLWRLAIRVVRHDRCVPGARICRHATRAVHAVSLVGGIERRSHPQR